MADETPELSAQHEIELPNGIVVSGMGGDVESLQDAFEARHEERTGQAVPETSPEPADTDTPATESTDTHERPMSRATKRVKEAVDRANAAEKSRAELEARMRELEQRLQMSQTPAAQPPATPPVTPAQTEPFTPSRPRPVATDFADYDSYFEALADWKADVKIEQRSADILSQAEARAQARIEGERAAQSFAAHAKQVFQRGQEAYPDFDTVISSSSQPMSPLHAQAILNSPHAEHVMYTLAKNPDQLQRFCQTMDPMQLGMMLGQMGTSTTPAEATETAGVVDVPI